MSGLCMAASFDGSAVTADLLGTLAGPAAHRGAAGTWTGPGAGAVQLAWHDAAPPTNQPLVDGSLVCVADARIDAWDPMPAGRSAAPVTPAEIIVSAYRRWGTGCAAHLVGDFAFVIWDSQARRLFAARDPMGARTLYHRVEPRRRVLVASEAKQVLAAPGVPRRLNEAALLADIAGHYALPQMSPYEGIAQLAPGFALEVDTAGQRTWRYWDIDHGRRAHHRDQIDYADEFREVFATAVRDRIPAGVPAGMLLSGGLDSTAIAATSVRERGPGAVHGFSWAFDEPQGADERAVSAPLAAELGIPVTDVVADDAWPLHDSPRHGPDEDDPFAPMFEGLFARTLDAARDAGMRVLLTSERGDEMTGNWVYDDLGLLMSGRFGMVREDRRAFVERTGGSTRRFVRDRLVAPLVPSLWPPGALPRVRGPLRRMLGGQPKPLAPWVPETAARRLDLRDVMAAAMPIPRTRGYARMQRYMSVFHVISLRIAQARSRTWARWGLDYADPWGDRRIAEFVCAAPQWVVQRHSEPKKLVRDALRGVLPDAVRLHPAPSGFGRLFDVAFKARETATVRTLMTDSRAEAAGLLDASAVLASYDEYLAGGGGVHDFWLPISVELWLRRWWD